METFVPYKNVIDGKAGLNHLINPSTAKQPRCLRFGGRLQP